MTAPPKGTHSVVFDHTRCDHTDDDNHDCQPDATWSCNAQPGGYCVYGCEQGGCGENGWTRGDDNPTECSYGHKLAAHECWVVQWLENTDLQNSFADGYDHDPLFVHRDGVIDIVEWDSDYLVWEYGEPVHRARTQIDCRGAKS